MKLIKTIVENIINKTLYIKVKSEVLNTKYKELIYKKA